MNNTVLIVVLGLVALLLFEPFLSFAQTEPTRRRCCFRPLGFSPA